MMWTLRDYQILLALVRAALPRLDFADPDHALAGGELLAAVNRVGAMLRAREVWR